MLKEHVGQKADGTGRQTVRAGRARRKGARSGSDVLGGYSVALGAGEVGDPLGLSRTRSNSPELAPGAGVLAEDLPSAAKTRRGAPGNVISLEELINIPGPQEGRILKLLLPVLPRLLGSSFPFSFKQDADLLDGPLDLLGAAAGRLLQDGSGAEAVEAMAVPGPATDTPSSRRGACMPLAVLSQG